MKSSQTGFLYPRESTCEISSSFYLPFKWSPNNFLPSGHVVVVILRIKGENVFVVIHVHPIFVVKNLTVGAGIQHSGSNAA